MQRVGTEGAKVLLEIGEKIKTMRKLGKNDILYEVHEAAEELQKKIDRRSYLLVNSESWEIGGKRQHPEEINESDVHVNGIGGGGDECLGAKSQSETVLDLRSVQLFSKSWDVRNTHMGIDSSFQQKQQGSTLGTSPEEEILFKHQLSWPARRSCNLDEVVNTEEECKTYESASALSLATFSSLLIEFVARLQNVVNAFEELAMVANFKDSVDEPVVETSGFSTRLLEVFKLK